MTTNEVLQLVPKPAQDSRSANSGPHPRPGYIPNFRERSASKKVDDISKHESKHDMAPKHDPKPNARVKNQEWKKPGGSKPQGGNKGPGNVK